VCVCVCVCVCRLLGEQYDPGLHKKVVDVQASLP